MKMILGSKLFRINYKMKKILSFCQKLVWVKPKVEVKIISQTKHWSSKSPKNDYFNNFYYIFIFLFISIFVTLCLKNFPFKYSMFSNLDNLGSVGTKFISENWSASKFASRNLFPETNYSQWSNQTYLHYKDYIGSGIPIT